MKQCKMLDLFDEYNKNRKNRLPTFMELINCNDEFAFSYHGITYELINGDEKVRVWDALYIWQIVIKEHFYTPLQVEKIF